MAFFVYVDGSGSGRDPKASVATVGGYVAHEGQWAILETRWADTLRQFGVSALHMNLFAHSVEGSDFETWKGDEDKRAAFMGSLIDIIKECGLEPVTATVVLNAYENINDEFLLRETIGAPYAIAAVLCMGLAIKWHEEQRTSEPLMIVVENGDNDQAHLRRFLARLAPGRAGDLVTDPIFQRKQWTDAFGQTHYCLPFQTSDFIAYEASKMLTDFILKGKRKVRQTLFRASGVGIRRFNRAYSSAAIRGIVKSLQITPRFNRGDGGAFLTSAARFEPLCYQDVDRPIVSDASRVSVSLQAPRAVLEAVGWVR